MNCTCLFQLSAFNSIIGIASTSKRQEEVGRRSCRRCQIWNDCAQVWTPMTHTDDHSYHHHLVISDPVHVAAVLLFNQDLDCLLLLEMSNEVGTKSTRRFVAVESSLR